MASLIRRTYTKTDPKTGKKVKRKTKKWYGKYRDADEIVRRVPLSENKVAAPQMLAQLVKKAELAKAGVKDDFETQRETSLLCPRCQSSGQMSDGGECRCPQGAHLSDYRRSLEAKDKDPRYISQAVAHCAAIFDGTGARSIADIDANKVECWLAELRRETGPGDRGGHLDQQPLLDLSKRIHPLADEDTASSLAQRSPGLPIQAECRDRHPPAAQGSGSK